MRFFHAPTFVYFVQAGGDGGAIKIGYTNDVEKRLGTLRTGNHLPLRLLAALEHLSASTVEAGLHRAFSDLRMEGEWFRCDDRILDAIAAFQWLTDARKVGSEPPLPARFAARIYMLELPITDEDLRPLINAIAVLREARVCA